MFKNKILITGGTMKNLIKKMIPKPIYILLSQKFRSKRSYSQSGEDMILNVILCNVKKGFYVDIGANNPLEQSNTCFFYEKGWNGINIDALPGSMKLFNILRKRDINLEIPISDIEETLTYCMFQSSFYNSFDEEIAAKVKDKIDMIDTKKLDTKKLSWVLDNYCPTKIIDFFTIDTEGFDLKVLKSNDWNKYCPKVIVIEINKAGTGTESMKNEIVGFLEKQNYTYYCNTPVNAFFIENTFLKKRFPGTMVSI